MNDTTNQPKTIVRINSFTIDTDFFQGFNWFNFNLGDPVYLDDCEETDYLIARFESAQNTRFGWVVNLTAENDEENLKSHYRQVAN